MQKQFRVTWEIDIYASTPKEAAKMAQEIQLDSESTATVFEVYEVKHNMVRGKVTRVDLCDEKVQ